MTLENVSAYLPFMVDSVTIRERKADWRDHLTNVDKACVMDVDSFPGLLGMATGWKTAVIFRSSDYDGLPTRNSTVDPDPNGKWTKLTVQKSYIQTGLIFLLCSTEEQP